MCKQGFDDALMFLHRNNLINCTRCLAVQSTFVISETVDESLEFDPECQECKLHRQVSIMEVHSLYHGVLSHLRAGPHSCILVNLQYVKYYVY